MAKGVFHHRPDSVYDDLPESQYQFPKRYMNVARDVEGDWIVYYEPQKVAGRAGYSAIAKVQEVIPDPRVANMFIAVIEPGSYLPLQVFVPRDFDGRPIESYLQMPDGSYNRGKIQQAMRRLPERDFTQIIRLGFPDENLILPRRDDLDSVPEMPGLAEAPPPPFVHEDRLIVEQTITRKVRDRVFRRHVLDAYDSRCALSGLRLINGLGRAEVEAAHIRPVSDNGPDIVQNGLALSGTVHWMFDRGLIGLSDDGDILISRQVNNRDEVLRLVSETQKMFPPRNPRNRPHPLYLEYHRQHCFKH